MIALKTVVGILTVGMLLAVGDVLEARTTSSGTLDEEAPMLCPPFFSVNARIVEGFYWANFVGVTMFRTDPFIFTTNHYAANTWPASTDEHWIWVGAGGTYTCSVFTLPIVGTFYFRRIVGRYEGVLVPNPSDPFPDDPHGMVSFAQNGTSGGYAYSTSISSNSFTTTCYLTDWYTNGVYTDTTVDYCIQNI